MADWCVWSDIGGGFLSPSSVIPVPVTEMTGRDLHPKRCNTLIEESGFMDSSVRWNDGRGGNDGRGVSVTEGR